MPPCIRELVVGVNQYIGMSELRPGASFVKMTVAKDGKTVIFVEWKVPWTFNQGGTADQSVPI